MKTHILTALIAICSLTANAQSILSTSESKSGILVGDKSNYTGIGYESASDRFALNCRLLKQNDTITTFPDFWGINFEVSANLEKNKAPLIQEKQWNGDFGFELTFLKTWDKTTQASPVSSTNGVSNVFYKIKQNTFYFKLSDDFKRIKTFETNVLNPDTTFLSLYNPLQNKLTVSTGFNWLRNNGSSWYFSSAVSANISYINKSTRSLTASNLVPNNGSFINAADSSRINQFGNQESYYQGKTQDEIYFVPRIDFFVRRSLGNHKPFLGLLASYSPLISSIKNVNVRNCFAIGPTLGLSNFPSQVLFGLMNEFVQNSNGKFKYALTFNVTLPIVFR